MIPPRRVVPTPPPHIPPSPPLRSQFCSQCLCLFPRLLQCLGVDHRRPCSSTLQAPVTGRLVKLYSLSAFSLLAAFGLPCLKLCQQRLCVVVVRLLQRCVATDGELLVAIAAQWGRWIVVWGSRCVPRHGWMYQVVCMQEWIIHACTYTHPYMYTHTHVHTYSPVSPTPPQSQTHPHTPA